MVITSDYTIFTERVMRNRTSSPLRKPRSPSPNNVLNTCPWKIAPIGYAASYGCGPAPNKMRVTSKEGYSYILYNNRPCFWASMSDGTGSRCFPKAKVSDGVISKNGEYYYTGESGKLDKIEERFGHHLGHGKYAEPL